MRFTHIDINFDMMVTRNPQNVHRKYFWAILMTFISDVKIDINMCEPHYVYLFFLWTSSIVQMFDYLTFDIFLTTWHLFDKLTSFWYFGCKSPMGPIAHLPIPLYPIAHVPHCPCDPLPMWPIPLVPHTPFVPTTHMPHTPLPHTPCAPIADRPHGLYPWLYPCTPYPLYTIALSFWHFDTFNLNHLHACKMDTGMQDGYRKNQKSSSVIKLYRKNQKSSSVH